MIYTYTQSILVGRLFLLILIETNPASNQFLRCSLPSGTHRDSQSWIEKRWGRSSLFLLWRVSLSGIQIDESAPCGKNINTSSTRSKFWVGIFSLSGEEIFPLHQWFYILLFQMNQHLIYYRKSTL